MAIGGAGRIIPNSGRPKVTIPAKAATPARQSTAMSADAAERKAMAATPPRQSMAITADAAERRITAARNKAIAEVKKSPTSADAADRRIQNAVNKEIANITGKTVKKPTTKPVTNNNRPKTTTTNNSNTTSNNSNNNNNRTTNEISNESENNDDSGGQSATPQSFEDSTGSSSSTSTAPPPVKSAPIDTVLFNDESFSEEFLVDILFEDINGQELLTIARGDTVNGQEVIYQPIKNLGLLQNVYNPSNLLGLTETSASFFSSFSIQLSSKIPTLSRQDTGKNYYIEESTNNLVIELINMQSDDQVEIQLATSGTIDRLGI